MKVLAAFQSVALFYSDSSTCSNALFSHPQDPSTRTPTTAVATIHSNLATSTQATTRNRIHRLHPLLLSNSNDNPAEMANGDNIHGHNRTATATLDAPARPPPPQQKVLLSDTLPPLPEGSRRLYLVRHGETEWNTLGKIQGGGYDIPLNENGRSQAWTTAHVLDNIPINVIASSQLSRAKETADILFELHADTAARVIDAGFAEMSFGEFEGLAHRDQDLDPAIKRRFSKISKQIKVDTAMEFPGGGESTIQVEERSRAALFRILEEQHQDARHIAVVSHGRTNKVLLASVVLADVSKFPQIKQSNTCINVADVDAEGKWTVQTLNFIEHVKDNVIVRLPPP